MPFEILFLAKYPENEYSSVSGHIKNAVGFVVVAS